MSSVGLPKHPQRQGLGGELFIWERIQEARRGSGVVRPEGRKPAKGVWMGTSSSASWGPQSPHTDGAAGTFTALGWAVHTRPVTGDPSQGPQRDVTCANAA